MVDDVTIHDGGKTPILEKDLARIFVVRPNTRLVVMVTNWKIDGNICSTFSKVVPRSSTFFRLGVWPDPRKDLGTVVWYLTSQSKMAEKRRFWKKTWPQSFGHVTFQDGGKTPILEKDLARIFSSQP
jgi:hypothetical protein